VELAVLYPNSLKSSFPTLPESGLLTPLPDGTSGLRLLPSLPDGTSGLRLLPSPLDGTSGLRLLPSPLELQD